MRDISKQLFYKKSQIEIDKFAAAWYYLNTRYNEEEDYD